MKRTNKVFMYISFVVVLITIVTLIVIGIKDLPLKVEYGEGTKDFNSGWVDDNNTEFNAPFKYNAKYDDYVTFTNTIPSDFEDGNVIYIKMNYCSFIAYIDGVELETSQVDTNIIDGNLPWSRIIVPDGSQGKQIQLKVKNNGSKFHIEIHNVIYQDVDVIKFALSKNIIHTIEIVSTIMVLAILLFGIALQSLKKYKDEAINELLLCAFITLSAAWIVVDSDIQGIYFTGSEVVYLINYLVFFMIPLPFIFYMKRVTKANQISFYIAIGLDAFGILTYDLELLMKTFNSAYALVTSHIFIAIIMVIIFIAYTKEFLRNYKYKKLVRYITFCILLICAILTFANFYFTINDDNTSYYRYGIIFFILIIFVCTIADAVRKVKALNAKEKNMLMESEYKIMSFQTEKLVLKYDFATNILSFFNDERKLIETNPEEIARNGYISDESLKDYLYLLRNIRSGIDCKPILLEVENYKAKVSWYQVEYEIIRDSTNNLMQAVITAIDATDVKQKEKAYNEATKRAEKVISEGGGAYLYNLTTDKIEKTDEAHPTDKLIINKSINDFATSICKLIPDMTERKLFKSIFSREKLYGLYGKESSKESQSFNLMFKGELTQYLFTIFVMMSPYSHDIIAFITIEKDKEKHSLVNELDLESGLLTFNAFKDSVSKKLMMTDETNSHTMMLVEIDNFDEMMHEMGIEETNKIIKKLSDNIKAFIRLTDDASRVDSNKFALFLQYTSNDQAVLKKMIELKMDEIKKNVTSYKVKLCISISRYAKDGQLFDELYSKAYSGLEKASVDKHKLYIYE